MMRVVYFGTPEFAVLPLKRILEAGIEVAAVVTASDKPAGRGLEVKSSAVKKFAVQQGLKVLQPESLKEEWFIEELKSIGTDVFVVVAFRKLPREVWEIPPGGCFNLHASLLPQYRGAAPINHVLIQGEVQTGVTTFFIDDKIDTGAVILQRSLDISENETAGELHDRLMELGAVAVLETLQLIGEGEVVTQAQPVDEKSLKTAPRLFREHGKINWNNPAVTVHNHIRGLSPFPGAWSSMSINGSIKEIKLLKSSLTAISADLNPGEILYTSQHRLLIATGDEMIEIKVLQPVGKKAMEAAAFMRGIQPGTTLRFLS
ncbi:MAG: methionyl-tRNA formyltransferase [Lentimicrobiaceae bacterium]|nr:methionyl-tRNA formyltransferase [Lentimicrobiaceae bacterium]